MLSFRKFKSDYHARRWVDYEKVLMARTMASGLSRIVLSAAAVASGTENWHLTQNYIDKGTIPNMELALEIYPYAKAANQIHLVLRVVLFIACLKWHRLTKLFLYLECSLEVITAGLPTEICLTRDVTYSSIMIYLNFWLCYFNPVSGLITSSLTLVPVFVKRAIIHNEGGVDLAINFVMASLWHFMSTWLIHLIITKVGMIFVDAEVLREGNN